MILRAAVGLGLRLSLDLTDHARHVLACVISHGIQQQQLGFLAAQARDPLQLLLMLGFQLVEIGDSFVEIFLPFLQIFVSTFQFFQFVVKGFLSSLQSLFLAP